MDSAGRPARPAPPPGFGVRIGYGVGALAFGIGGTTLSGAVLQLYFNQVIGLPAVWVGAALMISIVIDAVIDPLVGRWSDNLRSPLGRRHTLMYASALPAALGFYLMWHAPDGLGRVGLFAFMVGMLLFVRVASSFFEIPSLALAPELAPEYDERTRLLAWRFLFLVVGGAVVSAVLYQVYLRQDAANPLGMLNRQRYSDFGVFASIVIFAAIMVSTLATHGRIRYLHVPPARHVGLLQMFKELRETFAHRPLAILMTTNLLIAVAAGVSAGLSAYLYLHFWGLKPQAMSIILALGPLSSFLSLWAAPRLSARFGKRQTVLGFYGTWLVTAIIPMSARLVGLMPPNGSQALLDLLVLDFFLGVGFAVGCHIVLNSMLSDAAEDVAVKTGQRSEGVLFAAYGLLGKCGNGVGAFVAGLLLMAVNFPEKAVPGTVDPAITRDLVLVNLPVVLIFNIAGLACISLYSLDRGRHEANLVALRRRGLAPGEAPEVLEPAPVLPGVISD
jgi:Na+/melibiose symporter-like transporter